MQEFEAKYAKANAAKEALAVDLDTAQDKVTQASATGLAHCVCECSGSQGLVRGRKGRCDVHARD